MAKAKHKRKVDNIYLRKDGRYEGRVMKGKNEEGKFVYVSVYANSFKECRDKLRIKTEMYLLYEKGVQIHENGQVKQFVKHWLDEVLITSVKPSTFANYVHYAEKWIYPFFGKEKIFTLQAERLQQFIHHLNDKGLSGGTIRNIYLFLNTVLKGAYRHGYIKYNPGEYIALPTYRQRPARVLDIEEQGQLERVAYKSDVYGLAILTALYTGLRVGEICALTWDDINFIENSLTVQKTYQRIQKTHSDGGPKTILFTGSVKSTNSVRSIPLASFLRDRLLRWNIFSKSEYVFGTEERALEPRILQKNFNRIAKESEVENCSFHTLRHTFATRCIEQNVDVKTLSEMLGHSSTKITLDTYVHSSFEKKQTAVKNLQELRHLF